MSIYGDRELDVRVAEAPGWRWLRTFNGKLQIFPPDPSDRILKAFDREGLALAPLLDDQLPRYSSDPATWTALLLEAETRGFGTWSLGVVNEKHRYACEIMRKFGYGDTIGEAICRAVLAWKGVA